ncbi:MAG: DUF935 family protein [Nitrospirae bacterium]|nr:DUF935 family protein [Nitrospirota bacterium]
MALVDRYGKPIKSGKPVTDEIAVATVRDRYSTYPSQGLTPERLTKIFKEADQGNVSRQAELFEEMEEKDLHLGSVLQTRKLQVIGLEYEILPAAQGTGDKKIAAAAKEMLEGIENLDDALLDLADAIGKGFSVLEIMWDISGKQWYITELKHVHQKRFTFNQREAISTMPYLLTPASPVWGEELIPNKFVVHRYRSRSGITPRAGLLRPCAFAYIFKNYNIKDWLIFNELFSTPMRMGKYQPGASKDEIAVLKQAVFNMGIDAAAVISSSTTIELLESKLRADPKSFSEFLDVFDKAISKAVLGHTGSADSTPGKLGADDQAHEVRHELLASDAKALAGTIRNQIIGPWVLFNYGPNAAVPLFKFHYEEKEDLDATAKVYASLVTMGFKDIGMKHIHERFGIPVPEQGEETLKTYIGGGAGTDSMATINNNANAISVNKATLPTAGQDTPDEIDIITEKMQNDQAINKLISNSQ